jgi:hypothetical protein
VRTTTSSLTPPVDAVDGRQAHDDTDGDAEAEPGQRGEHRKIYAPT